MTSIYDDLGGDAVVAALLVAAHQECEACAAGHCESGASAARTLAAVRQERAKDPGDIPQQRTGDA